MFRSIDIPKLVFQLLRPNYAITNAYSPPGTDHLIPPRLTDTYQFILIPVMFLARPLYDLDVVRRRQYTIASCQYGAKQVLAILNKFYSNAGTTDIYLKSSPIMYLYPQSLVPVPKKIPAYLFPKKVNPPMGYSQAYFSHRGATVDVGTIYAPGYIRNDIKVRSNFESDVAAMLVYGAIVSINYYDTDF